MTVYSPSRQIAAIDTSIAGHQALIDDAQASGMEILLLSGEGGGIEELAGKLSGMENIDGLHLFTHGSEGRIYLGDDVLSSDSLADHADALALIRGSFSEAGDLLVYGCNVGAGEQGQQFVKKLAMVTGADIAASDDLTGAAALGGDWDFEVIEGSIESDILAGSASFNGVLTPGDGIKNFSGFTDNGDTLSSNYFFVSAGQLGATPVTLPVDIYGGTLAYIDPADTGNQIDNGDAFYFDVSADGINLDTFQLTSLTAGEYALMDFDSLAIIGYLKGGGTVTSHTLTSTGMDNNETWTFDGVSLGDVQGVDLTKFRLVFVELESSSPSPYNAENSISSFEFNSFGISNAAAPSTNNAPSFENSVPGALSIDETATDTSFVLHDVNANDGDGGGTDSVTYSITSGNTSGAFTIDANNGEIRLADPGALDFEIKSSYTLTIQANDGEASNNTATQDITIDVNDIAPVIATAADPFGSVNEDVANGTSVGTLSLAANSDDDSIIWSIVSGNTGNAFAINGATGELTVNDTSQIDFETESSFALQVQATDGTTADTEAVNINIIDVNEPPTGSGTLTTTIMDDNAGATSLFQNLTVADPDAGENDLSLTITLSDSNAGSLDTSGVWSTSDGGSTYIATGMTVVEANNALANAAFTPTNNTGQSGSFTTDISVTVDDGESGDQPVLNAQTLTINRINDAPLFAGLDGTPSFTEGGAAVELDNNVTVSDAELAALNGGNGDYSGASLTLARNGGASLVDQFSFDTAGALFTVSGGNLQAGGQTFATFTNNAGTLTVQFTSTGTTATSALVNNVLQSISYVNSSNDPAASVDLDWTFDDGEAGQATGSTTVAVTQVNNAPVLTATGSDPTYIEGATQSGLFSAVNASTVEAADRFTELTLTVTNVSDGASEILKVDGSDLALTNGNSLTTAGNGITANVSVTGSTATVQLTGVTLTSAQMQTLVDGLGYLNTSNNPSTGSGRVVTITQVTDNGGTANGGVDTSTPNLQSTVSLTAVNNAPVMGNLDADVVSLEPSTIANIDSGQDATVANVDSADYNGGFLRITDTGSNNTANGHFAVDGTVVTAGGDAAIAAGETLAVSGVSIGTVHATNDGQGGNTLEINFNSANATDARIQTLLQNLTWTAPAGTGAQTFTVTLNDGDGTANGGADETTANLTMVLGSRPVIGNLDGDSLTYTEGDGTAPLDQGSDATLTDADSPPSLNGGKLTAQVTANAVAGEDVLTLDNSGAVSLSGTTAGSNVAVSGTIIGTLGNNIAAGNDLVVNLNANATLARVETLIHAVSYVNTNAAPDMATRTVSVTVTDNDGLTSQASEVAVNVVGVNEAPVLAGVDATPAYTEGAAPVVLDGDMTVSDTELDAADSYEGATLTLQRHGGADASDLFGGTGTLSALTEGQAFQLNGTTIGTVTTLSGGVLTLTFNANATSARVNSALQQITYANSSNQPPASVQIDLAFNDGNTGSQGIGGALADTGQSLTVNITAVNDAPTLDVNQGPTVLRSGTVTLDATHLSASDPDDDATGLTYTLTALPGSGELQRNAVTLTVGDSFTQQDILDGLVSFVAGSSAGNAIIDFTLIDGGEDGVTPIADTFTISVTSPPPPPPPPPATPDPVPEPQPEPDSDNDGVTDEEESRVPNLDGEGTGDGNGDGIPDVEQNNVSSVAFLRTDTAESNPGDAPEIFITLAAGAGDNAAVLSRVQQLDAPENGADGIDFPLGLLSFEAVLEEGVSVQTFTLFVEGDLPVNAYLKQDAQGNWVNLASEAFGGSVTSVGGKTRLDFVIEDGGQFDSDGQVNGVIVDPGGLAWREPAEPEPPIYDGTEPFSEQTQGLESFDWIWDAIG